MVFEKAQLKKDISNLEEASKTKGRRSKGSSSISNAKKRKSSAQKYDSYKDEEQNEDIKVNPITSQLILNDRISEELDEDDSKQLSSYRKHSKL